MYLSLYVQGVGVPIPSALISALPYIVTVVVLAIIARDRRRIRLNQPACLGRSFARGRPEARWPALTFLAPRPRIGRPADDNPAMPWPAPCLVDWRFLDGRGDGDGQTRAAGAAMTLGHESFLSRS